MSLSISNDFLDAASRKVNRLLLSTVARPSTLLSGARTVGGVRRVVVNKVPIPVLCRRVSTLRLLAIDAFELMLSVVNRYERSVGSIPISILCL